MAARSIHRFATMRPWSTAIPARAEAGLSLIEVLIALFILSIGMLGMLGTMTSSLRLTYSSGARSVAAIELGSIAEALRSNPSALDALLSAAGNTAASTATNTAPAPVDACLRSGTVACPQADAAQTMVALWKQSVAQTLLRGQGTVCRDSQPAIHLPTTSGTGTAATVNWQCDGVAPYVAKVCWDESRLGLLSTGSGTSGYQSTANASGTSANTLLCSWTAV
jgi:type IV pilus assembly protein PilV